MTLLLLQQKGRTPPITDCGCDDSLGYCLLGCQGWFLVGAILHSLNTVKKLTLIKPYAFLTTFKLFYNMNLTHDSGDTRSAKVCGRIKLEKETQLLESESAWVSCESLVEICDQIKQAPVDRSLHYLLHEETDELMEEFDVLKRKLDEKAANSLNSSGLVSDILDSDISMYRREK